jgi:hypothetical protein
VTIRSFRFLLFSLSLFALIISCSKINEATDLGDGTIPAVDGVNTFDTSITVETYNNIFDPLKDSIRVGRSNDQILGNIFADPFFGKSNAKIFAEFKPISYKWTFSGITDSLYIDSVVLVLGWKQNYGDTMSPQRVNVYELGPSTNFKIDSFYTLREQYFTDYAGLLGTKDFFPYQLNDSIKTFEDTTSGQLRIRLNNSFGQRLLNYDSTNAYASDSAFKSNFKGFAIETNQSFGNALMAFGLVDNANTKLAIYYNYVKDGVKDTTVNYFTVTAQSARHNYIERFNFAGSPLAAASTTPGQDDYAYLINTPGSFATVKIPDLRSLSNRIVHRAELIVEEVYDPSDLTFTPPQVVFLDVYDSTLGDYKLTPYDFEPRNDGQQFGPYGSFGKSTVDNAGNPIRVWKFNISRYVQNILTKKEPLHDFRLVAATQVTERYRANYIQNSGDYTYYQTGLNPQFAFGRVRVGGGNHATQRMRLRIVYSKI